MAKGGAQADLAPLVRRDSKGLPGRRSSPIPDLRANLYSWIDWSVSPSHQMRAAAIQLNSTGDKARNVETAERLVRAAAATGAELVVLPEKWNLLGDSAALLEGAEPLDGPTTSAAALLGPRAGHPPGGRQHRRAERRRRETVQHLDPDRPRRRARGPLPQDPHVRRRRRRSRLPRVRARGAGRGDRDRRARRRARGGHPWDERLLRPALPRALPDPRRARGDG